MLPECICARSVLPRALKTTTPPCLQRSLSLAPPRPGPPSSTSIVAWARSPCPCASAFRPKSRYIRSTAHKSFGSCPVAALGMSRSGELAEDCKSSNFFGRLFSGFFGGFAVHRAAPEDILLRQFEYIHDFCGNKNTGRAGFVGHRYFNGG